MSLEIVRRIRGNVHGSIDITELEDKVLMHSYFQRLRRIKQLAFFTMFFQEQPTLGLNIVWALCIWQA